MRAEMCSSKSESHCPGCHSEGETCDSHTVTEEGGYSKSQDSANPATASALYKEGNG